MAETTQEARLLEAVHFLQSSLGEAPSLAVLLGSGFAGAAETAEPIARVRFAQLPGFPEPSVSGHPGVVVVGCIGRRSPLVLVAGRLHLYEGLSVEQVVFPVRALAGWGVRRFLLVSAAGVIAEELTPGEFVLVSDHLNLTGESPLSGSEAASLGPRFVDLSAAYDGELTRLVAAAAADIELPLKRGVYAAVRGPQYETPAEVRMLARLGADLVGMSSVPEIIALRQLDRDVSLLCGVTNRAAGPAGSPLRHEEVLVSAERMVGDLRRLLAAVVERVPG